MSNEKKQKEDDIERQRERVEDNPGSGAVVYLFDRFERDMRWPERWVDSVSFKKLSESERLYQMSRAFLYSGIVLCEHAGDSAIRLGWPQASVCQYCLFEATELFLKACILHLKGNRKLDHNIATLW
jgi:hypothetical protein